MHLELPTASFLCAVLALIPLPWHWRAGTVPTISISLWLFFANLTNAVNTVLWADNVKIMVPVWCDISTKFIIGANIALPASIFCLCVHLERVSAVRQVSTAQTTKRRRQFVDGICCFGVPVIYMILHYIVQGHRFDIVEDFGCRATIYVSLPAIFLIWVPPLIFCLGSMILSGLAFRNFWIRRLAFARHLQTSNSALTPSRYFRLMSMSLFQMFWGLAITSFNMWFTLKGGLRPWTGWADIHVGFSRIGLFPSLLIPARVWIYTYALWWSIPVSTVIFFAFFAFGQDAMKEYRACFRWVVRKMPTIGRKQHEELTDIRLDQKVSSSPNPIKINISIDSSISGRFENSTVASPTESNFSLDKSIIPSSAKLSIPPYRTLAVV